MLFNNTGILLQTMLYFANKTDNSPNNTLEDFYHLPMGADTDLNAPKCYGIYGCFPIEYPYTTEQRPVSLFPESPLKINPKFPVFQKDSRFFPKFINISDPDTVSTLNINPDGNIYFIAHGYIESGDRPWIQDMVNALLDTDVKGTASVVVIDWGGGSSPPYTQAVANIRLVGRMTAFVIHLLSTELRLPNLDKVHMFGHSLGAHLCGYTGLTLQQNFGLSIGRITGMDPAEPLFVDVEPIVRLDKTDAKYVDIVHSDILPFSNGGLGMKKPIGHVDFYPNGGYKNPGCDAPIQDYILQENGSFFWGFQQFLSCNHVRSYQFMIDSISTKCKFIGVSCEAYDDFRNGDCFECGKNDNNCYKFGMNSISSYKHLLDMNRLSYPDPIKVYLMTGPKSPFCRTHYKVNVYMSASEDSLIHGGEIGIMSVVLHSEDRNETEKMKFSEFPMYFEPGFEYAGVVAGKDIGIPKYATLHWEYKANPLNPLTWRILTSPRIYIDHITIQLMESTRKLKLCSMYYGPVIEANNNNLFKPEYCDDYKESNYYN